MAEEALHECTPEICVEENDSKFSTFTGANLLSESVSRPFMNYCSPCATHFDDLTEFDYHIAKVHRAKLPVPQAEKKTYLCSICNVPFRRHDHLKRHIRSLHHAQKFSRCPVCGVEFSDKNLLSQHIKNKHAGPNETFNCRECAFQCHNLKELLIHELDHMERHTCPHCPMSYKRRDHLTRHVKSEHMKVVVVCPVCKQIYKRNDHLARHMREKHKIKNGASTLNSNNVTNVCNNSV